MKSAAHLTTVASVLAMASFSGAQANMLSLSEAISLSEAHSTPVQTAKAELESAKARLGEQSSRSLPQVGLSASATRYDDKTTLNFPGLGTIELLPDHQEQLALQINQDLDIGSQIGAGISQARLLVLSAQYNLKAAEATQSLTTTTAYFRTLQALED